MPREAAKENSSTNGQANKSGAGRIEGDIESSPPLPGPNGTEKRVVLKELRKKNFFGNFFP